jgi:competence protein ComEC
MRRPLLCAAVLYALGCLVGAQTPPLGAAWLLGVAAFALALACCARDGSRAALALGAACLALGAAGAAEEAGRVESCPLRRTLERAEGQTLRVHGIVAADPRVWDDRLELVVDLIGYEQRARFTPAPGRVRLEVAGRAPRPELVVGDRIAAWWSPRLTSADEARRDGIVASGRCKSALLVDVLGHSSTFPPVELAARARARAREVLRSSILPGPEQGIVLAMVLGDRSGIDEETAESFRSSGTYHVLALSGAQVALVASLLVWILARMRAAPWVQALVSGAAIGFYALLVGGDVPVVRAALMAGAVLAGRALELDTDVGNLLGLAALVLLIENPASAADVGFQLSFGATLALLTLVGPLLQGVPRLPLRIEVALAASLAAQAALAPLLAAWFHRIAPAALLMNLAAVPLSGAVLLSGFLVLAVHALATPLAAIAGDLAWIAAHGLLLSGRLGAWGHWLDLRVAPPSVLALALHACGLAELARGWRGRGLGFLALAQVLILVGPPAGPADGRLHLTVLDVGQGDALLLTSPGGRHLLVDAGGPSGPRFDPGERLVAPQLWRRGVGTLDAIVLSHAQADHVAGVPFVLRAFRVREVWEGPAPWREPAYRRLQERIEAGVVDRRALARGARLSWEGGVSLDVLGPAPPPRPPRRARNEDSLVIAVRLGGVSFLLPGDLEGAGLAGLHLSPSAVVKVPHHGSRSTSPPWFVRQTAPRLAIVSVGARNPFGQPHPEVLARYAAAGALVLRTDRDGAVEASTDGRRIWTRVAGEAEERRIR